MMMTDAFLPPSKPHVPVLLEEVLVTMAPQDEDVILDATFGYGGYSEALLQRAQCRVLAMDRDPEVLPWAQKLMQTFADRFEFRQGAFADMDHIWPELKSSSINGIVFDIGVSSVQLDKAERGFSFQNNGPLDMRMDPNLPDAAHWINTLSEADLADILFYLGDEKRARSIAKAVVLRRVQRKFETTHDFAEVVRKYAVWDKKHRIDAATKSFQAMRIWVNNEIGQLMGGLQKAERFLKPGGKLGVVTFHSLEDRVVKHFLKNRSAKGVGLQTHHGLSRSFDLLTAKPILPSAEEIRRNPRARSAKLRVGVRTNQSENKGLDDLLPWVPMVKTSHPYFETISTYSKPSRDQRKPK